MAYEVHGAGDPAVVLAPAAGDRHQWPAQVAYLARSHTVIVIDPPGPGARILLLIYSRSWTPAVPAGRC